MANNDIFKLAADKLGRLKISALNRAAQSTTAAVKNKITDSYNIKRKDLNDKIKLSKASGSRPYANISVRHQPVGLIYFSARQTKQGVTYAIERAKRKLWQSAFFVNISKAGDESRSQVFERYGPKVRMTKGRYQGKLRQRIRKLAGPSIAQMFIGRKWNSMKQFIDETFFSKFDAEFKRLKDVFNGRDSGEI